MSSWTDDDDYLAGGYGRYGVPVGGVITLSVLAGAGPHRVDPEDDQGAAGGIFNSPEEAIAYAERTPGRWMIMPAATTEVGRIVTDSGPCKAVSDRTQTEAA